MRRRVSGFHELVPGRDLPGCGAEAGNGKGFAADGPDEVLRARQRRVAASDELVPGAACVRLRGGGSGIGEGDQGPRGTGHGRAVSACLGGGRTPRNTATRAPFRLPLRQQISCDSALRPSLGRGRSRPPRSRAISSGKGRRSRSLGEGPGTETPLAVAPRQPDSRVFRQRTPSISIAANGTARPFRARRRWACPPTVLRLHFVTRASDWRAALGRVIVHGRVVHEGCQAVR